MSQNNDCVTCKWINECVNVGVFNVGDCLQYEGIKLSRDLRSSSTGEPGE